MSLPGRASIKHLIHNATRPFSYTLETMPNDNKSIVSPSILHHFFSSSRPNRGGRDGDADGRTDPFSEEQNNDFRHPPDPIPNRPLRGERRPNPPFKSAVTDGFDHISSPKPSSRQIPGPQFENRSRGGRREEGRFRDNRFTSKFEMGGGSDDDEKVERSDDEEKVERPSFRSSQFRTPNRPLGKNQPGELDFLEKFKLGSSSDDKKLKSESIPNENVSTPAPEVENKTAPDAPPEEAEEIFKKMKETGLIPNAVAMLDGLCKDGLVQDAMKLFGLMREKGTIPEVVIYTAVVEGFCKAMKFDDAKRIFRKMQNNGISPNAFSYTVLIQGLCKGKILDDAGDFCVEMLEAGHSPNVVTFTSLVDNVCKEKGVEEAEGVIRRLREKGYFVNDKAIREHMDKKGPFSPLAWEAIFGKKNPQKLF